jgi:tellurite resistance protein
MLGFEAKGYGRCQLSEARKMAVNRQCRTDKALAMRTYSETLARCIVAHVARVTADDPMAWVLLQDVARDLKVDDEAAETAMRMAVAWGWLKAEGIHLYRVCLTAKDSALPRPR